MTKIEPVTNIWKFVYAINFELAEMAKKVKIWTFQAQPASVKSYFIHILYVKVVLE